MEVDVDHIAISKFIDAINNSKYLTRYLDDAVRPLILILPKHKIINYNFWKQKW